MTQDANSVDPQSSKPEWFELADSDAPSAQVTKVSKLLPTLAVVVTGAIIATGAFFANASENNSPTPATTTSVNEVTNTDVTDSSLNQVDPGSQQGATVNATTQEAAPNSTAIANPADGGMKAPGGRHEDEDGDDDDDEDRDGGWGWLPGHDGDDDEGEHEEREHHEREERH